jgi:hypothetical protein
MPESGLPIRVYEEHDMWHVDYGDPNDCCLVE